MSEFDPGSPLTGGDTPAPAQQPATPAAPAAPAATPLGTPAPAQGAPQQDRSDWVPSYRLREAREAAIREAQTAYAQQMQQARAEADRYRTQLHSLVGVQPPQNQEVDAIKQQFYQIFPGAKELLENSQELLALRQQAGELQSQNTHYWNSHGRSTVDRLFSKAAEAAGAPLTQEAKEILHSAFVGWVSSSPERENRYMNDPTIVDDYMRGFGSSFYDPVRRTSTAGIPGRANVALPQDTPSGSPRAPGAPQPKDLDERVAMSWAMFNQNR